MKLSLVAVVILPVLFGAFSCASSESETTDTAPDAATPPLLDAASSDGATTELEAGPIDAAAPKPLDVSCTGDPCYTAVSGNGSLHFCGLLHDGTVRCWGRDSMDAEVDAGAVDGGPVVQGGALGRGASVSALDGATAAPVVGLTNVTQISVGPNLGTCARTSDGSVYCWGRNDVGQLGQPASLASILTPTRIAGLPLVDEVHLGMQLGCAIATADRSLYCWGQQIDGLDVDSDGNASFPPQRISLFPPPLKSLAVGSWSPNDTIIASLDGNILGNVGIDANDPYGTTAPLLPELDGVQSTWTFAYLTSDALVRRWAPEPLAGGVTLFGPPLSLQVFDVQISAAHVVEDPSSGITRASEHQGGALLSSGRLFRWGRNVAGTLGVTTDDLASAEPLEVTQVTGKVVSFAMTVASTCASLVNGTVQCWGSNSYGELGRGAVDLSPHPEAEVIR